MSFSTFCRFDVTMNAVLFYDCGRVARLIDRTRPTCSPRVAVGTTGSPMGAQITERQSGPVGMTR